MGDFSSIKNLAKHATRMGQSLSASMKSLSVEKSKIEFIPDIEVETDGVKYLFSDGIGRISLKFAKKIKGICGYKNVPSAFQIRFAGYKGVVVVDQESSTKLSLRPSMLKNESNNT